jgi:hypothetical protein
MSTAMRQRPAGSRRQIVASQTAMAVPTALVAWAAAGMSTARARRAGGAKAPPGPPERRYFTTR